MSRRNDTQPSFLDEVMPEYEFRGRVSVAVDAPSAEVFRALEEVTLADMPVAHALGTLRYLPGRLTGRAQGDVRPTSPFIGQLLALGSVRLAEAPDRELVIGGIGKLHQVLDQQFVRLRTAEEFRRFDDPAYEKLAQSFRVEPGDRPGAHRLALEHRTHALSPAARRKFGRYWLVIKPMGNFVGWLLLRAVKRRAEARGGRAGGPIRSVPPALPPAA